MKIYTRGGDKLLKQRAKSVAQFCADKLMTKRLSETLTVTIKFEKLKDICGDCCWEDEDYRPKEFLIRIDSRIPTAQKLKTLCHEMVHVKQYARDEMKEVYRPAKMTRYNGAYYSHDMDYWDQPWEIEAHGREPGLYTRWVDASGNTKNKTLDKRF